MYLRMINKKAKWEENREADVGELSSDVITTCLKTSGETLSLWYLEDGGKITEAIIALASNRERVDKLDYLIIPKEYIVKYALELKEEKGNSPYENFNDQHWNIINLTYSKLGTVSKLILDLINSDGYKIERVPAGEVSEMLAAAIKDGRIKAERLNDKLRDNLLEGTA